MWHDLLHLFFGLLIGLPNSANARNQRGERGPAAICADLSLRLLSQSAATLAAGRPDIALSLLESRSGQALSAWPAGALVRARAWEVMGHPGRAAEILAVSLSGQTRLSPCIQAQVAVLGPFLLRERGRLLSQLGRWRQIAHTSMGDSVFRIGPDEWALDRARFLAEAWSHVGEKKKARDLFANLADLANRAGGFTMRTILLAKAASNFPRQSAGQDADSLALLREVAKWGPAGPLEHGLTFPPGGPTALLSDDGLLIRCESLLRAYRVDEADSCVKRLWARPVRRSIRLRLRMLQARLAFLAGVCRKQGRLLARLPHKLPGGRDSKRLVESCLRRMGDYAHSAPMALARANILQGKRKTAALARAASDWIAAGAYRRAERLLRQIPGKSARFRRGYVLYRLGRWSLAASVLRKVTKGRFARPAQYWRARSLAALGRKKAAHRLYERLGRPLPGSGLDFYGMAALVRIHAVPAPFRPMPLLHASLPSLSIETFRSWIRACRGDRACRRAAWLALVGRREAADQALRFSCGCSTERRAGRARFWHRKKRAPSLRELWIGCPTASSHPPASAGAKTSALLTGSRHAQGRAYAVGMSVAGSGAHDSPPRCEKLGSLVRWLGDASLARAMGIGGVTPTFLGPLSARVSEAVNLPRSWLLAVIQAESGFEYSARSAAGAIGLMQLMPHTARKIARDMGLPEPDETKLFDPKWNMFMGGWYLARLLLDFSGNLPLALAAYNAGPDRVRMWLSKTKTDSLDEFLEEIPYRGTAGYLRKILAAARRHALRFGEVPYRIETLSLPDSVPPIPY